MKTRSIKGKLVLFSLILLFVPSLIIGIGSFLKSQSSLDTIAEERLKLQTKMVIEMIEMLDKQVKEGQISLEDAQEMVKVSLLGEKTEEGKRPINQEIAIGDYGYVVILDEEGNILSHPAAEGKNISEAKTEDGFFWGKDMISKAVNGGGFSHFEFPLPDKPDVTEMKIAYTEKEPTWGWLVSSAQYMNEYRVNSNQLLYFMSFILILSFIIGLTTILIFVKRFTSPITSVGEHLHEISKGNLSLEKLPVNTRDEIGRLSENLNEMTERFKEFIQDVTKATEHVASSSAQLNAITDKTSKVTEDVSHSIQEVAVGNEKQMERIDVLTSLFHKLSKQLVEMSETVKWVRESTEQAKEKSYEGNNSIDAVIEQMNIMNQSSKQMEDVITSLGMKSNEISEIISLITNIADQTNLLALNAAIEAARAGEHGKGFAVVADEVRKLAEQSGESATRISQLISEIQDSSEQAKSVVHQEISIVQNGMILVNQAGEKFKDINETIEEVSLKTRSVSVSIEDINQQAGVMGEKVDDIESFIKQTATYATEVAASTEETAASVEEIATSSQVLASMADELQDKVKQFKTSH
ncbi:methyl-accepting chemotaxis protein [Cytobacillus sp. FJAT-54145]|uniref:Methyl-accepting chemotaxis protein n=1 Tax=Cytobacillus spartinae TaxID=3299023 RepID=A0ABW6KAD5_9BACI